MRLLIRATLFVALIVTLSVPYSISPAQADPHPGGSLNVAFVGNNQIQNGGYLPINPTDFGAFSFYNFNKNILSLANLNNGTICGGNACDTLVLNVASRTNVGGLGCTTSNLTAVQKADINAFAAAGGKVIIYDSECTFGGSVDYSWLTYPFTTSNPGATGARTGTLVVAEENILSTTPVADPHYINTTLVTSQTDAVGDMNLVDLATVDPNWCLDLTGINVRRDAGATHMYAPSGTGLLIYNGLDMDYVSSTEAVDINRGDGNLAKLWLQELQAESSLLPCGRQVIGISLNPPTDTNPTGTSHTVTALLANQDNTPVPGLAVNFTVISGPNVGATGTCSANADCTTDANGEVSFTYVDTLGPGIDEIKACYIDPLRGEICSRIVTKEWVAGPSAVCDVDSSQVIDITDIRAILAARSTPALPGDPRDADGDGTITSSDAKICIASCTNPRCAP